ncbi:hypothetical protein [Actinomadura roseirufa]|uniref:hypothetical protein n=1 Tax=Actinomadura roseirufa TaxID=2094049 RepID=UPI0013F15B57|nr:hypothetical protein [Actinomadura roseirufa]
MDDTNADADAAVRALRAAGLWLSCAEIGRIGARYRDLRAKADALSALDPRDDPPVDAASLAATPVLPGEEEDPR